MAVGPDAASGDLVINLGGQACVPEPLVHGSPPPALLLPEARDNQSLWERLGAAAPVVQAFA